MTLKDSLSDKNWSLFLDRDGVINKRIINDYVRSPNEFIFLPGVLDAMRIISKIFKFVFVVTNQQGIGKGIMSEKDLKKVHDFMQDTIGKNGGRIDRIYFSPHLERENHQSRKPNPGMALQAQKDYPEVDFSKSIMVGDMEKDMEFGRKLGMLTVFIGDKKVFDNFGPDHRYDSLLSFAKTL
jgi:histidinol-phosphate phosphatase family protein